MRPRNGIGGICHCSGSMNGRDLPRELEELVLECHGVRFGIRSDVPNGIMHMVPYLPPGWRQTTAANDLWYTLSLTPRSRNFRLLSPVGEIARGKHLNEVLDVLEATLQFEVAVAAPHRLFVHAGAVGWRGNVLVLPGRSRSGKTTLVEALIRAGATYFSDEYVVLDAAGNVHPYARALSVRVTGSPRPRRVDAEEIGGPASIEPWPVGLIALVSYQPGAGWRPCRLTSGEALLGMLANTVVAQLRPSFALDILGVAVAGKPALSGQRSEATETAARLLELMDRSILPKPGLNTSG